ncbi:aspartyl-phosphate phosphatase Spo0E family protein [Aquibacillus rhizosphaerae]|uniref:Aspartyl-phosphate phosphatase Spo0E family protein n=1 Tax=Aquibacillus rhizosphaerae TaxID=3051431 RepID=A0ABT7L394_9BACI|nr:aspartyl-phosphate phosphatase Spo0E family protein [Aquibacillus sp. LR5S19]MDL4839065.1 aspartyl-phosphate phosphatase Spo0E family protein [Aquibacillus sp. LR5S19]
MKETEDCEKKIEALRKQLFESYKENQLSEEVVHISQELDRALNELHYLTLKSKTKLV